MPHRKLIISAAMSHLGIFLWYQSPTERFFGTGFTCRVFFPSFLGFGLNELYRRASSNTMIIGAHLAKLVEKIDAVSTNCIGIQI